MTQEVPRAADEPNSWPAWIFEAELEEIDARRQRIGLPPVSRTPDGAHTKPSASLGLLGLALSGGGIRSATFNAGFLRALAEADLLKWVDFLSTVSGGGYIGGLLSTMLLTDPRTSTRGACPLESASFRLDLGSRTTHYLSPSQLSGTATIVGSYPTGLLQNLLTMMVYLVGPVGLSFIAFSWFLPSAHVPGALLPVVQVPESGLAPARLTIVPWVVVGISLAFAITFRLWTVWRAQTDRDIDQAGRRFGLLLIGIFIAMGISIQPWATYHSWLALAGC